MTSRIKRRKMVVMRMTLVTSNRYDKMLLREDDDCSLPSGKWLHFSSEPTTEDDGEDWHQPYKIQETKGRIAAQDYKVVVRQVLKHATSLFCACLVTKNIYPDHMMAISWVQEAWTEGCNHIKAKVRYNNEIIQLVSRQPYYHWSLLYWILLQITMWMWQLTGELKTKICPLVETMYSFKGTFDETSTTKNQVVVAQLKMSLEFCYKICYHCLACAENWRIFSEPWRSHKWST